jgi:hypothetical protein
MKVRRISLPAEMEMKFEKNCPGRGALGRRRGAFRSGPEPFPVA